MSQSFSFRNLNFLVSSYFLAILFSSSLSSLQSLVNLQNTNFHCVVSAHFSYFSLALGSRTLSIYSSLLDEKTCFTLIPNKWMRFINETASCLRIDIRLYRKAIRHKVYEWITTEELKIRHNSTNFGQKLPLCFVNDVVRWLHKWPPAICTKRFNP
jgi:hypothetical protein